MKQELIDAMFKEADLNKKEEEGGVLVYLIEVLYKSGQKKDFWCTEFEYKKNHSGMTFTYKWVTSLNRPLFLHVDEIESVWVKDADVITKTDYNRHKDVMSQLKDHFEPSGETK